MLQRTGGIVAVAALAGSLLVSGQAEAVEVGQVAPEIACTSWHNDAYPKGLASLRGRVVLLVFWSVG